MNTRTKTKAVVYTRFSSDLQREESIEAQARACKYYAQKEGIDIVRVYADRAKSGKSVKGREEFLQMIEDSSKGEFNMVLVHKLNRFGRDGLDTLQYKKELERNGATLVSVTEKLDNSPEGRLMLMVIAGMNEFYSANLANEVMKGLKENAYNGKHTGGRPPLGYDVDPNTKTLVINELEAQAVRIIFEDYLAGEGYTSIIRKLNAQGFKTKRGEPFGRNSIHEILKNQKYTGVFIYNRGSAKSVDGTFNRHKYKDDEDIIKIDGGVPAIISRELYEAVQAKMDKLRRKFGCYNAKEVYLLSGKVWCGECGSSYSGNSRRVRPDHPKYVGYRCSRANGKAKCRNSEIRREDIERLVLDKLADKVFSEDIIPIIANRINAYIAERDSQYTTIKKGITDRIKVIDKEIGNIVTVVASTASRSLMDKLTALESEKSTLEAELAHIERDIGATDLSVSDVKKLFTKARNLFKQGTLSSQKKLIDTFVDRVTVYKDRIEIQFNIVRPPNNPPPETCKDRKSPSRFFDLSDLSRIVCER